MKKVFLLFFFVIAFIKGISMESEKTPAYLYKILSSESWQASLYRNHIMLSCDDDAFIHFSRKDQLEPILIKYWSDAPALTILKIETAALGGDLVFEANPGGTSKYYHLYNGHIPFHAVVESNMIFRDRKKSVEGLEVVQAGHPALREMARLLSDEEILSPEMQAFIEQMKVTMRQAPGVGLAAPQVGRSIQLAVIEDCYTDLCSEEDLKERERKPVPFHVIINPKLTITTDEHTEFVEGCLSLPQYVGVVSRAKAVRVECLNERAEPVVIEARGWYARILQHEIDHLNSRLYVDRADLVTFMTGENYAKFHKEKKTAEAQ